MNEKLNSTITQLEVFNNSIFSELTLKELGEVEDISEIINETILKLKEKQMFLYGEVKIENVIDLD